MPAARIAERSISLNRAPSSADTKADGVLVIAPQWVGDAILSLPLIAQLAEHHHPVDVLATPAVQAVYACCPQVRDTITVNFAHGQLQWSLRRKTAQQLRGRYATAVILPNSIKSALIPWMAGIVQRRARPGEFPRRLLLTDCRPLPRPDQDAHSPQGRASMLDHYLGLSDQPIAADAIDRLGEHRPRMVLPAAGQGNAASHVTPNGPVSDGRALLVICPGAEYGPAKQWPAEHFARVARHWIGLSEQHGVAIVGGPKDVAVANAIEAAVLSKERLRNLAGQTSLLQAFAWIARARAVVSNDSGLMHAAAALDVPVIGIYGSSDPLHTPPHHPDAQALSLRLSCSPCFQRVCPLGTTACLRDLDAERVITALHARAARA